MRAAVLISRRVSWPQRLRPPIGAEAADEAVARTGIEQPHRRDRGALVPGPALDQQAGLAGVDRQQLGLAGSAAIALIACSACDHRLFFNSQSPGGVG
jgi:hypothetical protein